MLKDKGLTSHVHRKPRRNKPLSERELQGNRTRSKVRVRVEHIFGSQSNEMGGTLVRSIGLVRAKARIGIKNLTTIRAAWFSWSNWRHRFHKHTPGRALPQT